MKKISALFVALLFLFATVSFALAEENNSTKTGDNSGDVEDIPNELSELNDPVDDNETESEIELNETELNETEDDIIDLENETNEADNITTTLEDGTEVVEATAEETVENETVAETAPAEEEAEVAEGAGATPDNPILWGLDRALERIDLALTFGKSAKAQKGLAHAKERLLEVQAMIAAKKLDSAEKAASAYEQTVTEVQDNVNAIGDGDDTEALAEVEKVQQEIAKQEVEMAQMQNKIKIKAGAMTAEQQAAVSAMLTSLQDQSNGLKISAFEKKNKIEVKIKAKGAEKQVKTGEVSEDKGKETKTQANETATKGKTSKTSKGRK